MTPADRVGEERGGGEASPRGYHVGDRVVLNPESRELFDLQGHHGTVESVLSGYPFDGALHVRDDVTGELVGIGNNAVFPEERT